ncbi:MAG: NAD(P)/FAD-dependent oxidoreductase, partial [Clostridiales bacterium]|nr:NAD(P)/FAD-dependent oxidoreductase [Clostridiales bacterium]
VYITGKGRCNVTNACEDVGELIHAVVSNPKFLYSAFYGFTNQQVMGFFEESGVPLKVERGNRVFPVSDHSSDVIRGLENRMKKAGVKVHLRTEVSKICTENGCICGIELSDGKKISADRVLIATGGLSYPSTGSTGDGYRFARETGHSLVEPKPSLVPLMAKEAYISEMQGLSLRNITLSVFQGKKCIYQEFGEMMFTHAGVTGPLVLTASAYIGKKLESCELMAFIDLKPALSKEQLDQRILREFEAGKNKQFKNVIGTLYPTSMRSIIIELSEINPEKPVHDITKEERERILNLTKAFPFTLTGMGEFKEAIITRGGVSVKEIDPSTMESKKVKGLYFIGEVLDLDAVTGGFNLQIAWSTAWLAAQSV